LDEGVGWLGGCGCAFGGLLGGGDGEGRGGMDVMGRARDICRVCCSDSSNEHLK